jgi:3-(3-hydroxy-phenyl)propionate hydroxylase
VPERSGQEIFDVAIVGYGPVGALLANLLGQAGLSVLVIEKEQGIYPLPRAVHFDGEVMRVFESAGLRKQMETISRPGLKGMHFVNAAGKTLLIRGGGAALGPHGCATNFYFHQPDLEAVLREGVRRFRNVEVVLGCEVIAIQCDEEHVCLATVSLPGLDEASQNARDENGQNDDIQTAATQDRRARYVVGCDGARSIVRKTMGSSIEDLGLDQPWLVFDAVLNQELNSLPEHTVQHCDPARPMTYCNVTRNRRRWEIMLMPGDDLTELVKPEKLWSLVQRWIKPGDAAIERATIYSFHSVIAKGWRKARLLLAGDSAHQTPPFLGQGMCAGIRDASNLAWKLQAVLKGHANERLLDTYESERSPHVRAFIELAVRIGDIIQTTDPAKAKARDEKFLTGAPEVFQFPAPKLGAGFVALPASLPASIPPFLPSTPPPSLHSSLSTTRPVTSASTYSIKPESGANADPTGQIFPQPQLSKGVWLDQQIGMRFAIIADEALISQVSLATRETWREWDVQILALEGTEMQAWFNSHAVRAVILRPDRYILGVANDSPQLEAISQAFSNFSRNTHEAH